MFEHFATDFSRVFAVMWFSQSKDANEGDWALNTSQAAVDAWKAGIAKMKAMQPESSSSEAVPESSSSVNSSSSTTAIRIGGITDKFSFRQQGGKLLLQVDRAMTASVVQFDHQGRILWQSAVRHFTPGEHALDVPETSTRSIYRLSVQQ